MRRPLQAVCAGFLVVLAAGFVANGSARAQLGDLKALRTAFDNDKRLRGLMNGEEPAKKDDVKSATIAAEYYLFRLTHPRNPKNPNEVPEEFARKVTDMLEKNITTGQPRKNREFINLFGPALVEAMVQVFERLEKEPSNMVQTALVLPTMARLKQDQIGEFLLEIIDEQPTRPRKHLKGKGKQHDIFRLYALKGIREHFPVTPLERLADFNSPKVMQAMMNDIAYIEGLSEYITRTPDVKGMTSEEIDAVRFLRREAIISLGQVGSPAVLALAKPEKVGPKALDIVGRKMVQAEGLAAPALLRVLANDLPLPPSLQEQIEAANGLCAMKYDKMPDYNSELATYLVGRTLLDCISDYERDWVNFAGKLKKQPLIAWKYEAKRLETSLGQMAKSGGKGAVELHAAAKDILIIMSEYKVIQNTHKAPLKIVPTLRPTNTNVFKTIKAGPPIMIN